MKLKRILALALMMGALLPVSTTFVACDNDDDDEYIVDNSVAGQAKGEYKGQNAIAVEMNSAAGTRIMPMGTITDFDVDITKQTDTKVTVKLDDYEIAIADPRSAFSRVESKDLVLKNVDAVLNQDGSVALKGDLKGQEVQMLLQANGYTTEGPQLKTMTINEGSLTGNIAKDGTLTLTVKLQPGTMPMPLVYDITAKRK